MGDVAMVWIRTLTTGKRRDIEIPKGEKGVAHRSCEGSIYMVPGQSREVTSEEWEYIKKHHADLLPFITVIKTSPAA